SDCGDREWRRLDVFLLVTGGDDDGLESLIFFLSRRLRRRNSAGKRESNERRNTGRGATEHHLEIPLSAPSGGQHPVRGYGHQSRRLRSMLAERGNRQECV